VGTTVAADALVLSEIDAFFGDSHVLHGVSLRLAARSSSRSPSLLTRSRARSAKSSLSEASDRGVY